MSDITIYENFNPKSPKYTRHINHILNRIKTGRSKDLVYKIRTTKEGDLKMQLPCILFSGDFSYRNAKSLVKHSGFICLDFDKFPDSDTLLTWRDTLESDDYTYSVFVSPSGNGLKCLVKIPADATKHRGYFDALKDYYGCPYFDTQCSDVSRICFESYDPFLTINENSLVWDACKEYKPVTYLVSDTPVDEQKAASILLKWWIKKFGVYSGGRNSNIFKLCAAFNDYGVNRHSATEIVMAFQQEDFKASEIENIIKSAYRRTDKFGTLRFTTNG